MSAGRWVRGPFWARGVRRATIVSCVALLSGAASFLCGRGLAAPPPGREEEATALANEGRRLLGPPERDTNPPEPAEPESPSALALPDNPYAEDTAPSLMPPVSARAPWPARHRSGVRVLDERAEPWLFQKPGALSDLRLRNLGLRGSPRAHIDPRRWPQEPEEPQNVDSAAFSAALGCLCPREVDPASVAVIAESALSAARRFSVDPFALAALAFHQSRCEPRSQDSYGIGLTRVSMAMHGAHVRDDAYVYGQPRASGGYARMRLPLAGRAFSPRALLSPEVNLYFAALFLRAFSEQCPAIDRAFLSAAHRHPVSHFIYGDAVRSPLPESLVLTARRRLLSYYAAHRRGVCASCEAVLAAPQAQAFQSRMGDGAFCSQKDERAFVSPLDGAPRIVIGVLGDPRAHGTRVHAGIDLLASEGEPVRAMQSGVVIQAGVDLKTRGLVDLPPARATEVPLARMGPRGLFVRIAHPDGKISLYAHLARYTVRVGELVAQGARIGDVGRSGVQTSDAHLHLGIFAGERVLDPLPLLAPYVLFSEAEHEAALLVGGDHGR